MKLKITFLLFVITFLSFNSVFSQQIELPIEVLGDEGLTMSSSFTIDQEQLNKISSTDNLYLRANNLGYEGKASVQVNGGSWISLIHSTVKIYSPEKERGGMTNGGYNTIRFTVTISSFQVGVNTITFRFDKSDGISNGYRVIDLDVLNDASERILKNSSYYVLPGTTTRDYETSYFIMDAPEDWKSPYYTETDGEPDDLSEKELQGKNLWYYGSNGTPDIEGDPLLNNYLPITEKGFWYGYTNLSSGKEIKAKCTSCHLQDGRDLEIFSYSNKSIIERSKFHALTEEEGKLIATYIRSLSEETPTSGSIGRYGRPWNPPYQPGPQLEGKPIEQWAAGAGLDAVLEEDADMFQYLFPDGVTQEELYKVFDSDATSDRTEIPVAIQFPDWKHWLPIVHPMDAYTKDDYWNDTSKQYDPKEGYKEFRQHILDNLSTYQQQNITEQEASDLMKANSAFHSEYRRFLENGSSNIKQWRTEDGTATSKIADDIPRELAAASLARLMAVQYFEVMNEFNFQDKAHWFTQYDEVDHPKARQWFGDSYQVFEVPPHFQACVETEDANGKCLSFKGQEDATGKYNSTNWYQLQSIVNGGEGMMTKQSPVDYNYQNMFILKASSSSGLYEPLRYYQTLNTMYRTKTWSGGGGPNTGSGFRIRVMGPWFFYGMTFRRDFEGFDEEEFPNLLNEFSPGLRVRVTNALLLQFLTEVEDGDADTDGNLYNEGLNKLYNKDPDGSIYWERYTGSEDASNKLEPKDILESEILKGDAIFVSNDIGKWVDQFYYLIPKFYDLGVDDAILERLINWCAAAWTNINWYDFSFVQNPVTWRTGAANSDYDNAANWYYNAVPNANSDVIIPSSATINMPATLTVNSMSIAAGASIISTGTITGPISYTRTTPNDSWYLISSPVAGQDKDAFVTASNLATGEGNNIGFADYDNSTGAWSYYQSGVTGTGDFGLGEGHAVKLAPAGDIVFTGTFNDADASIAVSNNINGFNLIGNPYLASVSVIEMLEEANNATLLSEKTIWLWDQSQGTQGAYVEKNLDNDLEIAPGQAFFVSAAQTGSFNINESMQNHNNEDTFQKTTTRPEVALTLSNGAASRTASVFYIDGATTGFDNGYDSSIFGGLANDFSIFTHAVANGSGRNLGTQSLPDNNFENMIIPVGVIAESGSALEFSARLENLPEGIKVFLEDNEENTFTCLDALNASHKITTTSILNGVGRFYLHTAKSVLSIADATLDNVSVFTVHNSLRIIGLQQGKASVKLFNVLGKQVLNAAFESNGMKDIPLPRLAKGIYIVQLETAEGTLNKKIILE
jgi:hypothetical protein